MKWSNKTWTGIFAACLLLVVVKAEASADWQRASADIKAIEASFHRFRAIFGRFPTAAEGLDILVEKPSNETGMDRWRQLIRSQSDLVDPWGNRYELRFVDSYPTFYSKGRDGISHSDGFDDDDLNSADHLRGAGFYQSAFQIGYWFHPSRYVLTVLVMAAVAFLCALGTFILYRRAARMEPR